LSLWTVEIPSPEWKEESRLVSIDPTCSFQGRFIDYCFCLPFVPDKSIRSIWFFLQ
jgi:hypothetical protein